MNVTPINNFACGNSNLKNNNLAQVRQKMNSAPKAQSFGMEIKPDIESLNKLFVNYNVPNSQNFLIKYFLTKTLEKDFGKSILSAIFEEALMVLRKEHPKDLRYKLLKVRSFIPDFPTKVVPLKIHSENGNFVGVIGDYNTGGMTNGLLASEADLMETAKTGKNPEIFHDPIKNLAKTYAKNLLAVRTDDALNCLPVKKNITK